MKHSPFTTNTTSQCEVACLFVVQLPNHQNGHNLGRSPISRVLNHFTIVTPVKK